MKVIALFSGGIDSTVMLYRLRHPAPRVSTKGDRVRVRNDAWRCSASSIIALSFDYGQRHGARELLAAATLTADMDVQHDIVNLRGLRPILSSGALTGDDEVPEGHYEDETMKATVVPNRNMIMLSIAAGYAMSIGYDTVAYAAHAGDHAIYPDCRTEFITSIAETIRLADWSDVDVLAPFKDCDKRTIVEMGAELGVPFGGTWSCYKGGIVHCGVCGTCVERREAFELAGVPDPTVYQGRSNVSSS